jgi:hypothetical protein
VRNAVEVHRACAAASAVVGGTARNPRRSAATPTVQTMTGDGNIPRRDRTSTWAAGLIKIGTDLSKESGPELMPRLSDGRRVPGQCEKTLRTNRRGP